MDPLRDDDPRALGPFTLRGRLGAGGMGVVYLASNDAGTEVAVKTVPRGVGDDVRIRLQREAELLATIDHPRIARFVDADADADAPWLAMRYVSGPSLSDAQLPLPPQQLRQLADGLAEALTALHRLGVTHRDVKPGNIIMTTHGAVLVDLGIAVTADAKSMTMAGTAVGSPAWMAPEQFAGDPTGPPADVWGWAAVLTYAASGHEPFGTGSLTALAHRIMTQPPNLQGVPDWLAGPVRAAFAKQPDRRPTAGDLTRGGRVRVAFAAAPAMGARPFGPVPPPVQPRQPGQSLPPGTGQPSGPVRQPGVGPVNPQLGPHHPSGPQQLRPSTARRPAGPRHAAASSPPATPRPPTQRASTQVPSTQGRPSGRQPVRPRRRTSLPWLLSAAVLVAAAVVAAVVFVLDSGGDGAGGGGTGSATATAASGPAVTVSMLKDNGLCEDGCVITGQVTFTHPKWGEVRLVSTQASKNGTQLKDGYLAVFDAHNQMRWSNTVSPVRTLKPIADPVDDLRHVFFVYNQGSSNGIIVLSSDNSSEGMTSYSSVPFGGNDGRFTDATVAKVDGRYRITVETNNCDPSCSDGTISKTTYAWDGSEYSAVN